MPISPLFSYPRKLELGAARLSQNHPIAPDFELENCGGERGFDLDSVLVAELISSADVADDDGPVFGKFPDGRI